ncbi:MAG: ABC transporter ATP-binding protein [Acidimicrobiia bacterium]|nr:ABC transporter ATP-binding protein [Acidimicrobiia bacterium]
MGECSAVGAALGIVGLSVSLGGRRVLDSVDLEVAPNTTLCILGASGCGKTTLLRAVAGLVELDAGEVSIGGREITSLPPHRRDVGLVFQDLALFPHRRVAENVAFGLRMAGWSVRRQEARVTELLDLVGLAGYEQRRVSSLSGGEAQRVALARSIAPSPAVLLLDEPLAALDRELHRRLVEDLPQVLDASGATVVHVTHDPAEALALADRLAVMGDGRVLQVGEPMELWKFPVSETVARLLGMDAIADAEVRAGAVWIGGVELFHRPGAPDGPARVLVRPDAVRGLGEASGDHPDPRWCRWPAVVSAARFVGAASEISVEVAGRLRLRVAAGIGAVRAPGEPVAVVVDPSACVLWPPPAGSDGADDLGGA